MKWILFSLFSYFIFSSMAQGVERYEFYNGVRSLGMGGVGVAVVNDETALLVNPAALGKLRNYFGTVFDPELEMNENFSRIYAKKAIGCPYCPKDVIESLLLSPETYYHYKMSVFPSFVLKNFGIGLIGQYSLDAQTNADATAVYTRYVNDMGLVLGYNFRFWDGRIKLGFAGRAINRVEVNQEALDTTGSLELKDIASEGLGLGVDAGLILSAPWKWIPTLAAVVRDVGNTRFSSKGSVLGVDTRPADVQQDIDVGFSVSPIHANHTRSVFSIERKKLTSGASDADTMSYYHLGYELNLSDIFFMRLGWNQKFYTVGAELASEYFQVQFAYYGEEVGTSATSNTSVEDRRTVVKVALRF